MLLPRLRTCWVFLAGILLFPIQASHASPFLIDKTFVAEVIRSTGDSGTSVGSTVTARFIFDISTSASFDNTWWIFDYTDHFSANSSFHATTGSFDLTESAFIQMIDDQPNHGDTQFIEGYGPDQFGIFLGGPGNTELNGTALSDLNFDVANWPFAEMRWNKFGVDGRLQDGWTAQILSISDSPTTTPPVAGVPEADTWIMMVAGFGLLGIAVRKRAAALA